MSDTSRGNSFLLCGVGAQLCALRLDQVTETMRLLPIAPIAGAPAFVLGLAIVRGVPVPVVDAGLLLGVVPAMTSTRLVSLNVDGRRVGLAVDSVLGIHEIEGNVLRELPPLLDGGSGEAIDALATLDSELLMILDDARLVPDSTWAMLDEARSA
jgi:purine-binding chemotaxis protein CheW